jgi:ABC-2 type transport system permease protein
VIQDLRTIVWKEWKEIFLMRGSVKRSILSAVVIPLVLVGVFMPWQEGRAWAHSATTAVFWIWLPVFLVSSLICDSFAGERERKTLESLLATRLDDRTILLGKIGAAVGYGWGLALACVGLGFVTVNAVHAHGKPILLPSETVFAVVSISFLASALIASAGVLISLHAPTVRHAQQTMSLTLLGVFFGAAFGLGALPSAWKDSLARIFAGANLTAAIVTVCLALLALDVFLVITAIARFQRARLILD